MWRVPREVSLATLGETSHDTGVTDREVTVDGVRWAIVEYGPGAKRTNWCQTPHSGFVISGIIRYEFEDGRQALIASAGDGLVLPSHPPHRGSNPSAGPTRLFLIDAILGV